AGRRHRHAGGGRAGGVVRPASLAAGYGAGGHDGAGAAAFHRGPVGVAGRDRGAVARRLRRGRLRPHGQGSVWRRAGRGPGRAERPAVPDRPHGVCGAAGHDRRRGGRRARLARAGLPGSLGSRGRGRTGGLGGVALKVLVTDPLSEEGLAVLRAADGVVVEVRMGLSEAELVDVIGDYDGLIVRSGTRVTARVIEAGRRLKVIGRAGVGVDNIDVDAATRRGVLVINAPEGNTVATAEHAIALMLALARWIPAAHASVVRDRRWERQRFIGVQIHGKVLGVVGLGRVGSQVARRAQALGMTVIAYDPYMSAERARELGVELTGLDDLCRRADFITVHTPLTLATRALIGPRQFALMKDGVRIINCARGGIIDEQALYEALQSGKVAGAALDVFEQEPPWGSPLLESDKVIVTPHLGASTVESQVNVAVEVAAEVVQALKGEPVRHPVNLPVLPPELMEKLWPFVDVAGRSEERRVGKG